MAKWLAKEFDWDTGRYTGRYYDIAEAGIVAVFVDSFYGLDTNAGTPASPFKTLSKAITTLNATGANGSRIFMNGIFSENLPAQTYWYEFIGCGGGRNGRTVFLNNITTSVRPIITKALSRYYNIETLNYNYLIFSYNIVYYALNCLLKFVEFTHLSNSTIPIYRYSVLFNNTYSYGAQIISRFYLYDSIIYNLTKTPSTMGGVYVGGISSLFYNIDNILINYSLNSFVDIAGQFINIENNDFNVRITSPLVGSGLIDEITGIAANVGGVEVGLPYNGISPEFTTEGGATITDLTIDASGKFTITAPATTGSLETALMDLGNIYPLENIDLFNVFDFLSGEITQGVFETFSSPRMALTIKLKYGLTSAEVDDCPWLLIEYGKQPTFSGIGASRVGNADDIFDPDTFQTITCRYMKLFITLQNNS